MSNKTFNSKYAAGSYGDFGEEEFEVPGMPGTAQGIKGHGFDLSEFDLTHVDKDPTGRPIVVHTNNWETIAQRNRYKTDEFGDIDYSRPVGILHMPKPVTVKHEECDGKGCSECGDTGTVTEPMMPEIDPRQRKFRKDFSLEIQRSRPIAGDHKATKAFAAMMGMVPSLTQSAHDVCGGTGLDPKRRLFEDRLRPCAGCEGRGNTLFDTTASFSTQGGTGDGRQLVIPGGHAELQHSLGIHNLALQYHNFFCNGEKCFDGCRIEPLVRHIREGKRAKNHTTKDWEIKHQTGRASQDNGWNENLRSLLAYTVLEDQWEPTAPGLRAISAKNNLEGSATTAIRPGDIVGFHGGYDPGATILVHSVNADGSINGFRHMIDYESAMGEIEERNSRARAMDASGRPGLTQDLTHTGPEDSFSFVQHTGTDAWKNDERASLIDIYGNRLTTASNASTRRSATHKTIVDRKPTDVRWVENIHPDTVSKLNPVIEPHLQYRGEVYQTMPFGRVTDNQGNRLVKRTGEPYAQSTYDSNVRVKRIVRGSNPWSLSSLHETFSNMTNGDEKSKMYQLLSGINRANGVGSTSGNSDRTDFDHPLNVVPPETSNASTPWVRSESGTLFIPGTQKKENKERTVAELADRAKSLGATSDVKVEGPLRASDIAASMLQGKNEKFLRDSIDRKMTSGPMTDEQFELAKKVFGRTNSFDEAHKAVEESASGLYETDEENRNIEDRH